MSFGQNVTVNEPQNPTEVTGEGSQIETGAKPALFGSRSQESVNKPLFDRNNINNNPQTHHTGFYIKSGTASTSDLFGGPPRPPASGGLFGNPSTHFSLEDSSAIGTPSVSTFGVSPVPHANSRKVSGLNGGLFGSSSSGFLPSYSPFGVLRLTNTSAHDKPAPPFGGFGRPASTGFVHVAEDEESSDGADPVESVKEAFREMRGALSKAVREMRDDLMAELTEMEQDLESNGEKLEARVKELERLLEESEKKNKVYEKRIAEIEAVRGSTRKKDKGETEELEEGVDAVTLSERK